jgi:hypothetical protein
MQQSVYLKKQEWVSIFKIVCVFLRTKQNLKRKKKKKTSEESTVRAVAK